MARNRHPEHVKPRPAEPPKPEPAPADGVGPGWTIAIAVWLVMAAVLIAYEAWGFFGGMLRR